MKKMKLAIAGLLAVAVATTSGFTSNMFNTSALSTEDLRDLSTLEKAVEITDDTLIPNEYTFSPSIQYSDGTNQKTVASPFGEWDYTKMDTVEDETMNAKTGVANIVWIDKDDHSYDGKLGVYYDNVGTYNGQTVAMKVTYMGSADDATTNGFGLMMYQDRIGFRTTLSPNQIQLKYEFFNADTDLPLEVKGYQVVEDLDMYQGVQIDNYDSIYYSPVAKDTLKVVDYNELTDVIQSVTEENITDKFDNRARFTYTFSGSELNLTWTTSKCYYKNVENKDMSVAKAYKDLDKEQSIVQALNTYYYVDADGNKVDVDAEGATRKVAVLTFDLSARTPLEFSKEDPIDPPTDLTSPTLTVTKVAGAETYKPGNTVTYVITIGQTVEDQIAKDISLVDTLSADLDDAQSSYIEDSIVVRDVNGEVLPTEDYDVTVKDGKLSIVTSKSIGYKEEMQVVYNVKINDDATISTLTNNVRAMASNTTYAEDTTTVQVVRDTVEADVPQLSVVKTADKESYKVGEKATYTIKVSQLAKDQVAKSVTVKDELKPEKASLLSDTIKVFDKDGNEMKDVSVTVKDNDFTVETKTDLAADEFITITYDVEFKDASLAGTSVENTVVASATDVKDATAVTTVKVEGDGTTPTTDGNTNGTTDGNQKVSTQTGDRTPIFAFIGIALLSIVGITTVVIKKRR